MQSLRVLVTRPAHQADAMITRLRLAGHLPLPCPTLAIEAVDAAPMSTDTGTDERACDIAIFVSTNAVHMAAGPEPLTRQLDGVSSVFAIGAATAWALHTHGVRAHTPPDGDFRSESLLNHAVFAAVAGKRVCVFKGAGGRSLLADQLRARGAEVDERVVYKRRPTADSETKHTQNQHFCADVIQVGSNEALDNLVTITPAPMRDRLFTTALIVNSERGKRHAETLGFSARIQVAHPAGDDGQLAALARLAIPETTTQ
ncbi:MAG: uroporphyrinogen-III synthase [Pseudomonadota bacterium]